MVTINLYQNMNKGEKTFQEKEKYLIDNFMKKNITGRKLVINIFILIAHVIRIFRVLYH